MARHQIIYTSCMRGIEGVNDGQQVYSYDAEFTERKNDEVRSLFTYQVPSLQPGVIMTEEIAGTMPSAFSFRCMKYGAVSLTLNTYLGRDYMGSAGRFGNHLSHSVLCDCSELDQYPCEFYGGTMLLRSMEYEKVNRPEPPAYLPEPDMEAGSVVDPDRVTEFLGIGDRLQVYKSMVAAMLRFPADKRRVVICDDPQHVIMWIAALHYTLPLHIAKKVNFTTYEFDPELSPAQICGVIREGSKYSCESYSSSGRHWVFDLIEDRISSPDSSDPLFEFLDTAFSFSYDSLTDFHTFVMEQTSYREASEDFFRAYGLYAYLTDGIEEVSKDSFERITGFADTYCTNDMRKQIVKRLIDSSEVLNQLDDDYIITLFQYMLVSMDALDGSGQQAVKALIVDRLMTALFSEGISQNEFMELYRRIHSLGAPIRFSLPEELMVERNRNVLLNIMSLNTDSWKLDFLVMLIGDFVKDMRLSSDELYPDRAIGKIYDGIIRSAYASGQHRGYEVVEIILTSFRGSGLYLVNMTLNMDGFLRDLGLEESNFTHLWDYFINIVMDMPQEEVLGINSAFAEYGRYEEMFAVYAARVRHAGTLKSARHLWIDTVDKWFGACPAYAGAYAAQAVKVYEEVFVKKIGTLSQEEQFIYAKELFHAAVSLKLEEDYVDDLIQVMTEFMPLEKPNRENAALLKEMMEYQYHIRGKKLAGKLVLFCIGMCFDRLSGVEDVAGTAREILDFAENGSADIKALGEKEGADYLKWILDNLLKLDVTAEAYGQVFQLFVMTGNMERQFMEYCCKTCYRRGKEAGDYGTFSEFLIFMFSSGNDEDIENTGKYLCKLSKQRLEELDEEIKPYFKRDRKSARAWNEVRAVAEKTNPLLNNISGLLKRIRD